MTLPSDFLPGVLELYMNQAPDSAGCLRDLRDRSYVVPTVAELIPLEQSSGRQCCYRGPETDPNPLCSLEVPRGILLNAVPGRLEFESLM